MRVIDSLDTCSPFERNIVNLDVNLDPLDSLWPFTYFKAGCSRTFITDAMSTSPVPVLLSKSSGISGYGSVQHDPETHEPEGRGRRRLKATTLRRGLSARQVQMIAIAGTIGTGLFLGTGRSLAHGGPASMLICYTLIGFIVYVTLLLLGEMATQYPVAGSFNAYTTRFFSPSYGFALSWNYWFNDAVSVAGDLTAAQLVLQFWGVEHAWVVSLAFWVFLVGVNALPVGGYGELGQCAQSKILTTVLSLNLLQSIGFLR